MSSEIRYLSTEDVAAHMPPMSEIVSIVEQTLKAHGEGQTQMPAKIDLAPGDDAFLHAMPAMVQTTGATGMKWVAGYPKNKDKQIPYIHGQVVLNDVETGATTGILDARAITASRTAACTAVTAKHMADPNSEVMTIIGCGVQGRANIEALLAVFPDTERMLAYDTDVAQQERFADEVMTTFDLASIIPPDAEESCIGGHVIVTATPILKEPAPFIDPEWIQTGTLCVSLDFDAAFMPSCLDRAELFLTDDLSQYAHYKQKGHFSKWPDPVADLGAIVAGTGPTRPDGTPIVVSANLGLGVLDVALGSEILRRAEAAGAGTMLSQ